MLIDTAVMGARWMRLERPRLRRAARTKSRRHLALFASALPPSSSVGVQRPLSFMQYACGAGWRIDAFCSEPLRSESQHGDELVERVPREAKLHVVPTSVRQPSYRFFPRVDGDFTNAIAFAHQAIATMASDPPDIVMASGPQFFTFVAALFVARRFGVPLVLDYRDEWTECPFEFVRKDGSDRAWERRCLRRADAVLFTTESHRTHQLSTFPELSSEKAYVVSNGWDPDEFVESLRARPSTEPHTLSVAYVGSLAGQTPPHDFLASLEQLLAEEPAWVDRIRIQFIGRRGPRAEEAIRAFRFPGILEIIDHVGKREAIRRMQNSDVLLLISMEGLERYLPAKLFEYLAARRPILIFGRPGEASQLMEQLGAGVLCPSGSTAALREALLRLSTMDMSRQDAAIRQWLEEHERGVLAAHAFEIIEPLAVIR